MGSKHKKKRNKPYRGAGARSVAPQVVRVEAVNRGRAGQWWHEKKRLAKPVLIASVVALVIAWLVFELVRLVVS
jgi:hypothetical protein